MELCCSQSTDGGPVILPAPMAKKMNKSSNAQNGFNDLLGLQYKAPYEGFIQAGVLAAERQTQ